MLHRSWYYPKSTILLGCTFFFLYFLSFYLLCCVFKGHKKLKHYGALFTYLSSRAIHIKRVASLTTDSFILCLVKFIGSRGNIRLLRSDNGSNFVGSSSDFKKAFAEMDQQRINDFMRDNSGEWMLWKQNLPSASNMGGVWERQIRSARTILTSLLKTHGTTLNNESLPTLLIEVEAIGHSCPLTKNLLSDVNSMMPLSPINLLTLKSRVVMPPPGVFTAPDIYCCKHWTGVQHISNEFSSRWRKEVPGTCQCWQKWNTICKEGDIVLLKEAAAKRNRWLMAKIVATNTDENGFVKSVKLMLGTSGTTDMALQYLEQPVNMLLMLVENEWLRWYAWVQFHDREPFMNDWEVSICFNIQGGAMCRRDVGIETFTNTCFELWISSSLIDLYFFDCNWSLWWRTSIVVYSEMWLKRVIVHLLFFLFIW